MRQPRVNELDLLRFVAALAVVFFHYAYRGYARDVMSIMPYPALAGVAQYGWIGVQLFFMISGFVILMSATQEGTRAFIVSRVARLYPAFWVCCTITFIVSAFFGGSRYPVSWGQYLTNMTLLGDYSSVPMMDGVYWSLLVEIRFYALVAIVLAIGQLHRAQFLLALWLVIAAVLEFVPSWTLKHFAMSAQAPYFVGGAAFYLIYSKGVSRSRAALAVGAWCLAFYDSILGDASGEGARPDAVEGQVIVEGLITLFFVVFAFIAMKKTGVFGQWRYAALGALTYPLYLVHENVGFILFNTLYPTIDASTLLYGTIILMLLLSHGINRVVETRLSHRIKSVLNYLPIYFPARRPFSG